MHSILAVAACHWRYHLKSPQQRCYSEMFHSMQACSGLRHCLDNEGPEQTDAAMTTSVFLGSISFADTTEVFQVPLTGRSVPFFWLSSQLGLGALASLFRPRASTHSLWLGIFEEAAQVVVQLDDKRSGMDDIPVELATIFDVEETSTCDDHRYLRVLRQLCQLLSTDPENESALLQYMQFVDALSPRFLHLLNALDTRALMLLSFWLALLCAKDCWWSRVRARTDCWAICEHLEIHGDESLWKYMDFPAEACGYSYIGAAPSGRHVVEWLRLEKR